jgi:hypothetical protein
VALLAPQAGCLEDPIDPPPPPPQRASLECKFLGPQFRPVNAEPVDSSNGPGWYANSFFGFQASGGTGSYTWLESQYYSIESSVMLGDANSPETYTRSGNDAPLASQAQPGNIMVYNDAPGLPTTWANGATVKSGTYTATFNLYVTVTSGSQVVSCPVVAWYAKVNVSNGVGSGSGALGLIAH